MPLEWLRTADLIATNPDLDQQYVNDIYYRLIYGHVDPNDLKPLYVRRMEDGYYVNDGNHTLSALLKAGVEWVLADVYEY